MKRAFALLLAGGALGLAGATFAGGLTAGAQGFGLDGAAAGLSGPLLRVSGDHDGDDDGDHDGQGWFSSGGDDDCTGEDDGEDEDDGEEDCAAGGAGNAAPAGAVEPPKNGLFTSGTVPQVKSN